MSAEPPAAKPTTIRIGRVGYAFFADNLGHVDSNGTRQIAPAHCSQRRRSDEDIGVTLCEEVGVLYGANPVLSTDEMIVLYQL